MQTDNRNRIFPYVAEKLCQSTSFFNLPGYNSEHEPSGQNPGSIYNNVVYLGILLQYHSLEGRNQEIKKFYFLAKGECLTYIV